MNFDYIDINGRRSISIRDLRSKIVEQTNLKICQDFDLVISDAVTGQEYEDEGYLIQSGFSVIIKRVPAGRSAPSALPLINLVEKVGVKHTDPIPIDKSSLPGNEDLENFDDFGIDFYPALGESLLDSDPEGDKINCNITGSAEKAIPRSSETSIGKCQNHEPSDLSEAIQKGSVQCNLQVGASQILMKSKMEEKKIFDTMVDGNAPATAKSDLPSELRCSLCNTIFKEAVMIPCCQHSFCEKCIRSVLVEKARCPKCSSSKCRVEDLLPNLSLRQAIEHFLESQMLISGSDNILPKYVPDGESAIQAKDVSCAISVRQREPALPHSPSVTGKGSNQVTTEPAYQSVMRNKVSANRPSNLDIADGIGSYATGRLQRKGDRACYTCGSPDHIMRDCPAATGQYPMLQTGDALYAGGMPYGPPYWQGSSFSQVRPFVNMYASPGMMPFSPNMVPVTPYRVPSYMPSMYGGMQVPCGYMGTGGLIHPMTARAERPVSQEEFMELQDGEQRLKNPSGLKKRVKHYDDDQHEGYRYPQLSHDHKTYLDRDSGASYSGNSDTQRLQRKQPHYKYLDDDPYPVDRRRDKGSRSSNSGRDRRAYHHNISSSGIQEMSCSSEKQSKERHKHHHRSSKKHSERRVDSDVDSLRRSYYPRQNEESTHRKRPENDVKRRSQRFHSESDSGLEPSSSGDRRMKRKEESSHSSKHSRHKVKSKDDELSHERWEMIEGLNEENIDDNYYHHKRKRRH